MIRETDKAYIYQVYANIIFENGTRSGDDWQLNNGSSSSINYFNPRSLVLKNGDVLAIWFDHANQLVSAETYSCNLHNIGAPHVLNQQILFQS